ncbi:Macrophage mannose receptor 1-like [Aphelenchoides besseyi]|nr:Macrophage mannose receptor 1-like [Aphelenchoides besseyi]
MRPRSTTTVNWQFVLSFIALIVTSGESAKCPIRSIRGFPDDLTAPCYLFERFPTKFVTAERMCREYGGHLTSIVDDFVNAFVAQGGVEAFEIMTVTNFWIGAHDLHNQSHFEWIDDSNMTYTNWDKNQPESKPNTTHRCVSVELNEGWWHTSSCYDRKPYVCELIPGESSNSTTSASPTTRQTSLATTSTQEIVTSERISTRQSSTTEFVAPITSAAPSTQTETDKTTRDWLLNTTTTIELSTTTYETPTTSHFIVQTTSIDLTTSDEHLTSRLQTTELPQTNISTTVEGTTIGLVTLFPVETESPSTIEVSPSTNSTIEPSFSTSSIISTTDGFKLTTTEEQTTPTDHQSISTLTPIVTDQPSTLASTDSTTDAESTSPKIIVVSTSEPTQDVTTSLSHSTSETNQPSTSTNLPTTQTDFQTTNQLVTTTENPTDTTSELKTTVALTTLAETTKAVETTQRPTTQPTSTSTSTTTSTVAPTTTQPKYIYPCPSRDWHYRKQNNKCYYVAKSSGWLNDKLASEFMGAELASIHSKEEGYSIKNYVFNAAETKGKHDVTIGLYESFAKNGSRVWRWTDGSPLDFTNWDKGWPKKASGNELRCGVFFTNTKSSSKKGMWHHVSCNSIQAQAVWSRDADFSHPAPVEFPDVIDSQQQSRNPTRAERSQFD